MDGRGPGPAAPHPAARGPGCRGTGVPSLSGRIDSGWPGLRLQSMTRREYPESTAGASKRRESRRASSAAPASQPMWRRRSAGSSPRPSRAAGTAWEAWSQVSTIRPRPEGLTTSKGGGSPSASSAGAPRRRLGGRVVSRFQQLLQGFLSGFDGGTAGCRTGRVQPTSGPLQRKGVRRETDRAQGRYPPALRRRPFESRAGTVRRRSGDSRTDPQARRPLRPERGGRPRAGGLRTGVGAAFLLRHLRVRSAAAASPLEAHAGPGHQSHRGIQRPGAPAGG